MSTPERSAELSLRRGRRRYRDALEAFEGGDLEGAAEFAAVGVAQGVMAVEKIGEILRGQEEPPAPELPPGPFAPTAPWNTDAPNTTHPDSEKNVRAMLSRGPVDPLWVPPSKPDYGHPLYVANMADPLYTIEIRQPSWGNFNRNGAKVHLPSYARVAGGTDHHLTVLQPLDSDFPDAWVGFWECAVNHETRRITATSCGYSHSIEGLGCDDIEDQGNVTKGGFNLRAGLADVEEDSALFMLTNGVSTNSGPNVWPSQTRSKGRLVNDGQPDMPPIGARFVLDRAYDISGFPPTQRNLLSRMQRKGLILGDTGMYSRKVSFGLIAQSNVTSDGSYLERAKAEGWGSSEHADFGKGVDWTKLRRKDRAQ